MSLKRRHLVIQMTISFLFFAIVQVLMVVTYLGDSSEYASLIFLGTWVVSLVAASAFSVLFGAWMMMVEGSWRERGRHMLSAAIAVPWMIGLSLNFLGWIIAQALKPVLG